MKRSLLVSLLSVVVLACFIVGGYIVLRPWLVAQPVAVAAPPVILTVSATYPGANATVVADTIAAPIEQQVNGIEQQQWLRSVSRHDGSYTLQVAFTPRVDADQMRMLLQNRVAMAAPLLPDEVQRQGVQVRQALPPLMLVLVASPKGTHDQQTLAGVAGKLRDELLRLPGVGDVEPALEADAGLRVRLDADRLPALDVTVTDVVQALGEFGVAVKPGAVLRVTGVKSPEQLGDTIVAARADRPIRLRDVAVVERHFDPPTCRALRNGKPVMVQRVRSMPWAEPTTLTAAVRERLAQYSERLPNDVTATVELDLTAADFAPFEILLPANVSVDRMMEVLAQLTTTALRAGEVSEVLAITGAPFTALPNQGILYVKLGPDGRTPEARAKVAATLAQALPEARVRPVGERITLAVFGPEGKQRREFAEKLAERLRRDAGLRDAVIEAEAELVPTTSIQIDRARAAALKVAMADITAAIQLNLDEQGKDVERLRTVKVRGAGDHLVPLGSLVTIKQEVAPAAITRRDLQPVLEISANLAPGQNRDEAHARCEKLAEDVRLELQLPADYRAAVKTAR